jgi:hypothetical protein
MMGSVTATLDIDERGEISTLEAKGNPLLAAGAVAALRSAHFSDGCLIRTVVIRFSYRLEQDLDPHTPVAATAVSSDEYEIVAPAKVIEITISDPAWVFSRKGRFLHRVGRWFSKPRFW